MRLSSLAGSTLYCGLAEDKDCVLSPGDLSWFSSNRISWQVLNMHFPQSWRLGGQHGWVLGKVLLLAFLCPHMAGTERGRSALSLFFKGTIAIMEAPHSWPPKGLTSKYCHTVGEGFNIWIWAGHKHAVHNSVPIASHKPRSISDITTWAAPPRVIQRAGT